MATNGVRNRFQRLERNIRRDKILSRLPARRLLDMDNPLEKYNDMEFQQRYHIVKETAVFITNLIKNELEGPVRRGLSIPPILQFLTAQRYLCTNSFQLVVGDLAGAKGLPQPTICRLVQRITVSIAKHSKRFIRWPTWESAQKVRVGFYTLGGFPGVVGCIDGTQIPIKSPGGNDAELFRNRKQVFAINVQIVCDHELNFTNVIARWYGSAHDMRIFEHSSISADLEENKIPGILLGDAGYACLPYMMTPYPSPTTRAQMRYNKAQLKTRNCAERSIGCWKRRFPILNYCRLKLKNVLTVIVATAIIHNIARKRLDFYEEDAQIVESQTAEQPESNQSTLNGRAKREELILTHFSE